MAPCNEAVLQGIKNNEDQPVFKGRECHACIKNLCGTEDKERHRQKEHLNKIMKKCKNCKKERCPNHCSKKVESGSHCERCSLSWNSIIFSRGFLFYTAKN